MATPQQLQQATTEIFRDPEVARTLEAWKAMHDRTGSWMSGRGISPEETAFRQAVTATGKVPPGTSIGYAEDGSPRMENSGLPGWAYPLIIGGIVVTAGLATGAFAGAGAVGAGIGETGAVTGLAGSGLETGAALTGAGAVGAEVGTGTLNAGNFGALNSAAGGGGGAGRILTRDNILKGAGIVQGGIDSYQQNQRENERIDLSRDQLQLQRDQYALRAPRTRLGTSQSASILKNWSPVTYKGGHFEGGYRNPNLIDDRTRQTADDVLNQQLQDQLARNDQGR